MKFLKGLLITLLAIVTIWILLAMFSPNEYNVTREITTKASKESIWNQISTFEKWEEWSPWKEKDKTLVNYYEGIPGTVGSQTNWKGDPDISGTGNMIVNEILLNKKLGYDLQFGDFSASKGYIEIEEIENETKITWNDKGELPFLMRPVTFFGMFDKMMGPDFERGLDNLKNKAEQNPVSGTKELEISQIDLSERKYLGIRHNTSFSEVMNAKFFETNFARLATYMAEENIRIAGARSCIYYSWNFADSTTEVFPCFVFSGDELVAPYGMEIVEVANTKAIKGAFYGPYSEIGSAHLKMEEYCKENQIKTGRAIEEYITDPETVDSANEILTNIYYLIEE